MALDFGHPRFKRMFKLYWETGLRLSETFIGVINETSKFIENNYSE